MKRETRSRGLRRLLCAALSVCGPILAEGAEWTDEIAARWGVDHPQYPLIVRGQDPLQPLDISPFQPLDTNLLASSPTTERFSNVPSIVEIGQQLTRSTATQTVDAVETKQVAPTSTGDVLQSSNEATAVGSVHRSPVSFDPYVRGYRYEQILAGADGATWLPVRRDLDSMLSRTDPSLLRDIEVSSGPYGLRYGPGLAHININTVSTREAARFQNGYESHYRTGLSFRDNGGQVYGRETVYGGDSDWGYIVNWGVRSGSDYDPGDVTLQGKSPSSYKNQNFLAQIGFDLSPESHIEVRYNRLDATNNQYAMQFFNTVSFMGTDAVNATYTRENAENASTTVVDAWFNFTRMYGTTQGVTPGTAYSVMDRVNVAVEREAFAQSGVNIDSDFSGTNFGDQTSVGFRAMTTHGEEESRQLRLGTDFRRTGQKIVEDFTNPGMAAAVAAAPILAPFQDFSTNLPRAEMLNAGAFFEFVAPWRGSVKTSVGGRMDFATTRAKISELALDTSIDGGYAGFAEKNVQNDVLLAFYVNNVVDLDETTQLTLGGGESQRAPSLLDRYADRIFLGIIQNGFSRVTGEPNLRKELAWQIDVGVQTDQEWWRAGAHAFHSWINDYNSYYVENFLDPSGARQLRATNLELATMVGTEAWFECDVTQRVTAFTTFKYLRGTNHDLPTPQGPTDVPLYGITPKECRAGLRISDLTNGEVWNMELGVRMVDQQNRTGSLARGNGAALESVELATPGFGTAYVRGYYNPMEGLSIVGGVDNLFDRNYYEHLDLRLPGDAIGNAYGALYALAPGITPYLGVEWTY